MLTRDNAQWAFSDAYRLAQSPKHNVSRALRRFLADYVQGRYVFQSFAFDEGYSPEQLELMRQYAAKVDEAQAPTLLPLGMLRMGTQFDEMFGSLNNTYRLTFDLETATLKELQGALELVSTLASELVQFSRNPAEVCGFEDYVYRGYACNISDTLWMVGGFDKRGGSGVLEWCFDEDDAKQRLGMMMRFPDRFSRLKAEPWVEGAGMHWAVAEALGAQPVA